MILSDGQAGRVSPSGRAYPVAVDHLRLWEARPEARGSLTASAAWCLAPSSPSPLASTHGLQRPADLRGEGRKARRGDASADWGGQPAAEPRPRAGGGRRAEGRSSGDAGGRAWVGGAPPPESAPPRRAGLSGAAGGRRRQRARSLAALSEGCPVSMARRGGGWAGGGCQLAGKADRFPTPRPRPELYIAPAACCIPSGSLPLRPSPPS